MEENLEVQIRKLQEFYWSDSDPEGRGFVPLAELYRRSGNVSEARRILREGLQRHQDVASGHVVLGWVALDRGEMAEAEAAFRAALTVDPANIQALKGLGVLLVDRGHLKEALELHEDLFQLDTSDPGLPQRLEELKEQVEAAATVPGPEVGAQDAALKEAPVWEDRDAVAESLDWEGAALQADRSAEEPVDETPAVLVEEPVDEALAVEAGEPGDRVEAAEETVAEPEDDTLVTRTMGDLYLRQGLLAEARSVFQTLLGREPEDKDLQAKLQEVEERMAGGEPEASVMEEAVEVPDLIIPIQDLAPDLILPIADLAPDEPAFAETAVPEDVVPVVELAPEDVVPVVELAPEETTPVEGLAPEDIVPVEALAPDPIVAIADLAPDVIVPIGALAPDGPPEDPTLDDFEAWLDRLQ